MFPLRPLLKRLVLAAATTLTLAMALIAAGCSPLVGDACETNQQCGAGAVCDTTAPEGYCTLTPCDPNSCPEEAACIEFENDTSFCMLRCEGDGDCREGYACRTDRGPIGFCYVE